MCLLHPINRIFQCSELFRSYLHERERVHSGSRVIAQQGIILWLFCYCQHCLGLIKLMGEVLNWEAMSTSLGQRYLKVLDVLLRLGAIAVGCGRDDTTHLYAQLFVARCKA